MFKNLITFKRCEIESDEMEVSYHFDNVTFLRDFGPWKKGQKVENILFEIDTGIVSEPDGDTCKFNLEALVILT